MKPILAVDVEEHRLQYPYMGFPKIDGCRGLNIRERFVGRSGKRFKNIINSEFYSDPRFDGFDGEMVVDEIAGEGICAATTSALTTIKGDIMTRWCLFDFVLDGYNNHQGYMERYKQLTERVNQIHKHYPNLKNALWVIPYTLITSPAELEAFETEQLKLGFEGVILRDPLGRYKYGRTTPTEGNYLRLKRFMDAEIKITHVLEGEANHNTQTHTPHGYAERSTDKINMVPNGKVGTICGYLLKDQIFKGKVILKAGMDIELAPGRMKHPEREYYFQHQDEIINRIGKFQFFPVGIKDKPRFPTFQSFRDPVDL